MGEASAHSEQAALAILGAADISRRYRAFAGRVGEASQCAISAGSAADPFSSRHLFFRAVSHATTAGGDQRSRGAVGREVWLQVLSGLDGGKIAASNHPANPTCESVLR